MLRSGRFVSVDARHFRVFRRIYYWHFPPVLPRADSLAVLGYSLSRSWDSFIDVIVFTSRHQHLSFHFLSSSVSLRVPHEVVGLSP